MTVERELDIEGNLEEDQTRGDLTPELEKLALSRLVTGD